MKEKLFEKLLAYGQKKISFSETQNSIKEISNREISKFILDEYWGYVELEDLIKELLNSEIIDWKQFELEKEVEFCIKKYEAEECSFKATQARIQRLTNKKVSQYTLDNYWKSEDLEELVKVITVKEIQDWENIDDAKALVLITEIMKNPSESALVKRNGDALERKYSKTNGTVIDLIFSNDLSPIQILNLLKKNTISKS